MAIVCIALMAASAYGGYMFGYEDGKHISKSEEIAKYSDFLEKQTAEIRAQRLAAEAKEAGKSADDTIKTEKKALPAATPKAAEEEKKTTIDDDFARYNTMDVRVKTGAYVIVGIEKTVTAKQGQTIGKIAQSALGPGMSCYVEVVNGMSENQQLKEGTKVKIPKLRHKKALKK